MLSPMPQLLFQSAPSVMFLLQFLVVVVVVVVVEAAVYEVGPGKTYTTIGSAPLNSLKAGDRIRVYAKPNNEPYREKFVINAEGTEE